MPGTSVRRTRISGPILVTLGTRSRAIPQRLNSTSRTREIQSSTQSPGTWNAGSFVAQLKLSPEAGRPYSKATSPPLEEGQTEALVLNYDFPESGNFDTEVSINPAEEVAEKNHLNDIKLHTVTVAASKANPVITGVTVTSSTRPTRSWLIVPPQRKSSSRTPAKRRLLRSTCSGRRTRSSNRSRSPSPVVLCR